MSKPPIRPDDNSPPAGGDELIQVKLGSRVMPLTMVAILVAILALAAGLLGRLLFQIESPYANILIALGVALLLTAFGGQATLRTKQLIAAGVVAIFAGVFFLLNKSVTDHERSSIEVAEKLKSSYLLGRIAALPVDRYAVHLVLNDLVPSAHLGHLKRFDFVMFKDEIGQAGAASLEIEDKSDPSLSISFKIPDDCLKGFLGKQDRPILWKLDAARRVLIEERTDKIIAAELGASADVLECQKVPPSDEASAGEGPAAPWLSLVTAAFAQDIKNSVTRADIDRALRDIQSADNDVRRAARIVLSNARPEDVGYMLGFVREKLKTNPDIFRTKLGVSLALTEMLRRNKKLREKMKFAPGDLQMLLQFAGSDDRALRIYASEFLYDLELPAVTQMALPMAVTAATDDARFNWIFVSQGGWRRLSAAEKKGLKPVVDRLKVITRQQPKTRELVERFT